MNMFLLSASVSKTLGWAFYVETLCLEKYLDVREIKYVGREACYGVAAF
jgi:hypothetical protein